MRELGLTQNQLAEAVGMSQPGIGNCLKGHFPKADNLYYLSRALGMTMENLLTGSEARPLSAAEDGAEYFANSRMPEEKSDRLKKEVAELEAVLDRLKELMADD